ncbi:hypothetical protein PHMEG_00032099 [Phytophthora megakarya]|uniref:Uncharacterized protein n=1 Tax=Phytophthora megakarya TaxID=4795 RepID=A0A225UWB3_9STRA|nr:hypothetical protein PHMEG_00032099 [Phytophthora megakarya]
MSYARWIVFEKFMLLDEEPLLSFGTVANYLNDRHYKDGHRKWIRRQRLHDETYHTMAEDELEMRRAKMNVLHTNAAKHQFDSHWPVQCVNCSNRTVDTQHHRFGFTEQWCSYCQTLTDLPQNEYSVLERQVLLPDQAVLIPSIGHQYAVDVNRPHRETSNDRGKKEALWQPIVSITSNIWVDTKWAEWIDELETVSDDTGFVWAIRAELAAQTSPSDGRIIPIQVVGLYGKCTQYSVSWQQSQDNGLPVGPR